jgi:hypothetical protein
MTVQELVALIRKERGAWTFQEAELFVIMGLQLDNGRHHRVKLTQFRHENMAYVRFTAGIGSAEQLDITRATSALALNSHLAFGAVAVQNNDLVLTETQPLGKITASLAVLIISYLAHQADRYEEAMFRTDEK